MVFSSDLFLQNKDRGMEIQTAESVLYFLYYTDKHVGT